MQARNGVGVVGRGEGVAVELHLPLAAIAIPSEDSTIVGDIGRRKAAHGRTVDVGHKVDSYAGN